MSARGSPRVANSQSSAVEGWFRGPLGVPLGRIGSRCLPLALGVVADGVGPDEWTARRSVSILAI